MTTKPLGILGGTFDPVHNAHLRLAEEAMSQLRLGGVLWLPAGNPPHRPLPQAPAADRLAMLRLAITGVPTYAIDDAELHSVAPSYTVVTLERLRTVHGEQRPLVLLMGADAFLGLSTWHRWREIFRLAHVAAVTRPGFPLAVDAMAPELADEFRRRHRSQFTALATVPAGTIATFAMEAGTVSATEVRQRLAQGADVRGLIPTAVVDYIAAHSLYRPDR